MVTKTRRKAATASETAEIKPPLKSPGTVPKRVPPASSATVPGAAKPNLLRAGLKALGNVGSDVVQHQSRVFEAILGIDAAQGWSGLIKRDSAAAKAAQEALGLRKFEAVFDQRVANALDRLGLASIGRFQALEREVADLRAELAVLKAQTGAEVREPKPARRKR